MHGYDRNIAVNANKMVAKNTGCLCNLIVNGIKYSTVFSWNVYRNNVRKCSNISVKKYQKRPMFGCRSR